MDGTDCTPGQPKPYIVRVYILKGSEIAPKDSGPSPASDPYCVVSLGNTKISDIKGSKKNWNKDFPYNERYLKSTCHPEFFRSYELKAKLPGASQLRVAVWDYDSITPDDFIGETVIDLEDRWFNNEWQNLGLEYMTDTRYQPKPVSIRTLWVCLSVCFTHLWERDL